MFGPDQLGQISEDVDAGRPVRQRLAGHIPRNKRKHFAALLVEPERPRSGGEPGGMQMRQERLHGRAERTLWTPDRLADPNDPGGHAVPDEQLLHPVIGHDLTVQAEPRHQVSSLKSPVDKGVSGGRRCYCRTHVRDAQS
jgi:hypothetical protein